MTTDTDLIEEGFERLREECDPRGWELLDTLKAVALAEAEAAAQHRGAIDRALKLIGFSKKVPA